MEKEIKIGGKIPMVLNGPQTKHVRGKLKPLNELICYLYCFLNSSVYPGNMEQTTKTLAKMLQNATFLENYSRLLFNFPKKLCDKFDLQDHYIVSLSPKSSDAFDLYCKKLVPRTKLACTIEIEAKGKELQYAFRRIQRIVLNSEKRLNSITIKKCNDALFETVIESGSQTDSIVKINKQKTLTLVIYKLQEVLNPPDELKEDLL